MRQLFAINSRLKGEERRRSQLLRLVAISLLISTPLYAVFSSGIGFKLENYLACGLSILFYALAFIFNRLGRLNLAGWMGVLGVLVGGGYYLFTSQNQLFDTYSITAILSTLIIMAGLIIDHRAPFPIALVSLIIIISAVLRSPGISVSDTASILTTPITVMLLSALISWYYGRSHARLLGQLTERNRTLEEVNRQIEAKHQLELQIGDQINILASQVSNAFAEQTRGANDQLSAVVQVTAALEELNQTNLQIARAANEVADTAREALSVAEMGGSTIRYSTDTMHLLHAKVGETVHAMQNLSLQAREIDQIIELITEVAEETNLLALNATIEAAGAGEYGRRFAAVASEVQRLANRSRDAADAVRVVVGEVQEAIKSSTQVSQEGLQESLGLAGTAREIGESIEGIVQMVQNTATLAQQISFSIQQQKSAGTQVLDTMRQISNISDRAALGSRKLMETINELNDAADRLKSIEGGGSDNSTNPPAGNTLGEANLTPRLELSPANSLLK